ncbi:exonuclease domain-containing protein [Nocardioides massiliensis]|uniref:DNA polymerase-3 subunit epsilon n=1 Tax=Nocardioides massiliensis TaxID=1325935 RepID=A0ABT9NJ45_9ACTN|nr:exonuclease domain-containing protein [Nocardioides massiliensis]MDP9820419.1 DNA polymerase-3 subunit epsilon [Nocardioides massiliensis]
MSAAEKQAPWYAGRAVAFDFETTGIDAHNDRIVTAAVVFFTPGEKPQTLTWVIDPGIEIPTGASDVHGWTNDRIAAHLQGAEAALTVNGRRTPMTRVAAIDNIIMKLAIALHAKVPLVAFNLSYDATLIDAEAARHGIDPISVRPSPWAGCVDPFVIDKAFSKRRGSRKLTDQCAHYGVLLGDAHAADADAIAAYRVVRRQVQAYPELQNMSLSTLHSTQVSWRRKQMDGLRAYFDRTGKAHDGCCGSWPVHQGCCAPVAVSA